MAEVIEPDFGVQKIRVGIHLKDGSFFAPGTSLENSVIEAVETGPNAPDEPAFCTTDADGICEFDTPGGLYIAGPGDSVTFTQLNPPDGPGVLIDGPQFVGPCVVDDLVPLEKAQLVEEDFPFCGILDIPLETGTVRPQLVTHDIFGTSVLFIDPPAPPDAIDDSASVHTGHSVDVPVLANDVVYGAPTTISAVSHPAHGTAVVVGNEVRYTPTGNYGGPDTFTYTIQTPNGTDTATVHITVLAPPIAVDDSASTTSGDPGATVVIPVLANDSANGGSPLAIASATVPAHGTIAFSGPDAIAYTPRGNFVGVDTFTYTIATPNGTDTATVTVTVNGAAAAPLANTGVPTKQLGTTATLLLLAGAGATVAGRRRRPGRAH